MTFKSRIYLGIMAFSLALIVAVVSARRIQSVWFTPENPEEKIVEEESNYYPFVDNANKTGAEKASEANRISIALDPESAYIPEKEMQKPYFGGQIDLPALAKEQEAYRISAAMGKMPQSGMENYKTQEEIEPDFSRYKDSPELEKFAEDMRIAMAKAGLSTDMPPHEMVENILKNPQMQKILLEYSKDPKVMSIIDDMIANAQNVNTETSRK